MKKLLIISPHFPPLNAADMHRVRMSLPYFRQFGWEPQVVTVEESYSHILKDNLLLQSIPPDIKIHRVKALSRKLTAKLGLGSLALRSLWHYRKKVNAILKRDKIDLVFFSTTEFPVCILGAYWKKKFGIPYVIDMQDPWHSEYYQDKPKEQRPPKYWFSYRLHKNLEPIAMRRVDGLISVSENYIDVLKTRYPNLKDVPSDVITFGGFKPDLEIAINNRQDFSPLLQNEFINVVYVGRGGADMHSAIKPVFQALKKGIDEQPDLFRKLRFYFIGTSYAASGTGKQTILPLAVHYGVEKNVIEHTDRVSYYHALLTLQQADALFIPGSDDPSYSASKLYPYLLTQKPLLAVFNEKSNIVATLNACTKNAVIATFNRENIADTGIISETLADWVNGQFKPVSLTDEFKRFDAENLAGEQVKLFEKALKHFHSR